jgi:hypothetical protein
MKKNCSNVCVHYRALCICMVTLVMFVMLCRDNVKAAGCSWLCGGTWSIVTSTTKTIDKPASMVSNAMPGCNHPGETPPDDVTCSLSATSETVTNWQITGSLNASICSSVGITIGGDVGSTSTVTVSGEVGAKLTDFCQTCKAENGTRFSSVSYVLRCSCSKRTLIRGSVVEYLCSYIDASSGHASNPPCNPICPTPDGG